MLVKIPVTVDVDPKAWREEFGVEPTETAGDIRHYLQQFADHAVQGQVYKVLGVGRKEAQEAYLAANPDQEPMTGPND